MFDEARLDDPEVLAAHDARLRQLAETGARVRREANFSGLIADPVAEQLTPRAVVVAGAEGRLLRAVLEPWCPVPLVAWPAHGLPGWVGALDVVVAMAPTGSDPAVISSVAEANRRGAQLIVAAPEHSPVVEAAAGRWTHVLTTSTGDELATALVMLDHLHLLGLGPEVQPLTVADELDAIAGQCSPFASLVDNIAKEHAIALADATPLVWGGSVLAARAGRRTAEALRAWTGRPALAAPAAQLLPLIDATAPRDVFADPFDTEPLARPVLVTINDASDAAIVRTERSQLLAAAQAHGVREVALSVSAHSDLGHYACLQLLGKYAAAYLAVGETAT